MFANNMTPSLADIAAVTNKEDGTWGGSGAWLWIIVIICLLGGGFGGAWGNNNLGAGSIVYGDTPATTTEVYAATNQQAVNDKLNSIQQTISAGTYENARLIDSVNYNNMQNTNTINSNLNNGFNGITSQLAQLGFNMQQCCCNLKEQIMTNRYEDVKSQLDIAQGALSNSIQTQNITNNILGQLGKYYVNPPYPYTVSSIGTTIGTTIA